MRVESLLYSIKAHLHAGVCNVLNPVSCPNWISKMGIGTTFAPESPMMVSFRRKGLPLLTVVCALAMNAGAAVYYIDGGNAGASDNNAGTASAPWKTITKANQTLVAGDTVFIKQGVYSTYVSPVASGASGRPITYQNYSNDVVRVENATYGVWLSGKSWITVQGINFTNLDHQMILENGASHNVIAYCNFVGYRTLSTYDGSRIWLQSNYNWIHHCAFGVWGYCSGGVATGGVLEIGYDDGDSTYPGNYNLLEYNVIYDGGHHTLGVHGNHNVIRSNYTYNAAWTAGKGARDLYMNGYAAYCNRNLVEGNKIGYTYVPCDVFGANGAQVSTEWNIFRKNYFYYNNLAALQFSTTDNYHAGPNYNYVYNNTFMDNGWQTDNGGDDPQRAQIAFMDWATSFTVISNVVKNNLFYDAPRVYGYNGPTSAANQVFANNYNGDVSGSPQFVNATHTQGSPQDMSYPNLAVTSNSPVINAGGALTTITSASGSGTSFVVDDPNYFMDGWGIIQGDQIQLVGTTQMARITSVNYSTRSITVDTTLTWTQGQGISLPYTGTAPDIGAFEYGSGAPDTNLPPVVSVGPSQTIAFPNTSATLKGYATDPNRNPLTFTWSQITGPAPVTFSSSTSSNSTATVAVRGAYTLRLTASDGMTTSSADTTVTFSPDPTLVTLQAESGTLTAPFTAQSGYISQPSLTDITNAGRATYTFTVPNSGNYVVVGYVNAPDDSANSFWVNIDAEPIDPVSIWDIPLTSGFEARAVSWRGTAGLEFPRIFSLSAGAHSLIILGREGGVQLDRMEIGRTDGSASTKPSPPTNLRVVSASP